MWYLDERASCQFNDSLLPVPHDLPPTMMDMEALDQTVQDGSSASGELP